MGPGWGIVGTGAIAARFAVACHSMGRPAVAVVSRQQETGDAFAQRFGLSGGTVSSIADLAAHPNVGAVYIATPNATHHDIALECIAGGLPVLCEKPLACTAAQARAIADAASAANVFCMEGLWSLCLPTLRTALSAVRRGDIGELREVHGSFAVPHTSETMPRLFSGEGAGALLDRGVYLLALSQALLGPLSLHHVSGDLNAEGVDLAATLLLENATGARAVLSCAIDRMGDNRLTLVGTQGRITFDAPVSNPSGYRLRRADPTVPFSGPTGLPGSKQKLKALVTNRPGLRRVGKALLENVTGAPGDLSDQIRHVESCLAQNLTQSDLVPLEGSITVLELIDAARARLKPG